MRMMSSAFKPILWSFLPRENPRDIREEQMEVASGSMQRAKIYGKRVQP